MRLNMIGLAASLFFASNAIASSERMYEVTITNITKGVSFTPVLSLAHSPKTAIYEIGGQASGGVERIAEGGDISVLRDALADKSTSAATEGLLAPGESQTVELKASRGSVFSMISMLLPTNDTIVATQGKYLPRWGTKTIYARTYDAGTETNDELCASIPGPQCGGTPFSPEDSGEGYIYPSPGIHGEGDLSRADYNWQGAAAKIEIKRIW